MPSPASTLGFTSNSAITLHRATALASQATKVLLYCTCSHTSTCLTRGCKYFKSGAKCTNYCHQHKHHLADQAEECLNLAAPEERNTRTVVSRSAAAGSAAAGSAAAGSAASTPLPSAASSSAISPLSLSPLSLSPLAGSPVSTSLPSSPSSSALPSQSRSDFPTSDFPTTVHTSTVASSTPNVIRKRRSSRLSSISHSGSAKASG